MTKTKSFPSPIRTVEGITEYQLDNGLTVLLFPDTSAQNITVNVTYLVGSRHEGRGEAGMAHLLEHMLFKGTPTHPAIPTLLQNRGAFFNATTWFDRTNYFETLAATDENLEFALKLEADRMLNSEIKQSDLDAEMTVVRNEFEMGENDPVHVLHDQIFSAAYRWHNYGKTTIGNRSDIERVPVKNLKAFYQHYYQPDNAVLMLAGNFNLPKAQEFILQYFGGLPRPARLLDNTYTEEPVQDGTREVKLLRGGDVAQAAVAYHIPAGSHPDFPALLILSKVLSAEPSGILYQALVQSGDASEMFDMVYDLKEPGLFMTFARPASNGEASQVLAKMVKLLENLNENDINAESVERAKANILKSYKLLMKNSKNLALKLSEYIAQGDYRLFFHTRDLVKTVKMADVLKVAKTYLVESNRTTGLFIPTQEPKRAAIPATPDVSAMLKDYTGSETVQMGETFLATTTNIDARTTRNTLGKTIKTAFLNKATRAEANQASLIFRFGNEESLRGKHAYLQLIPDLMRRGSKDKSFQQVQDTLDKLQSPLRISPAQDGCIVVDISSDKENLAEVLSLARELMRSPRFLQEEFDIVKKRELADLNQTRIDPMRVGMNELERLKSPFPKDSIHYVPTLDEKIAELEAITFKTAETIYADLYGANVLDVAIVGDFDPAIEAQLKEDFGDWQSRQPYQRVNDLYVPALSETRSLQTPDKQMAIVAMGLNFAMRDDDALFPALRITNYIFGESMKSRLSQRLREEEGLSYRVGSTLRVSRYEPSASMTLFAMSATDKADFALKTMQEEYQRLLEKGINEAELEEGKKSYQHYFNNLLANDAFVLQSLGSMLDVNRTFAFYGDILNKIAKLQPSDIQKALDAYLQKAPVAIVKAGDFN